MNEQRLASVLSQEAVQIALLGAYEGPFSIGLAYDDGRPIVIVTVIGRQPKGMPEQITIDHTSVPIAVRHGYLPQHGPFGTATTYLTDEDDGRWDPADDAWAKGTDWVDGPSDTNDYTLRMVDVRDEEWQYPPMA